MTTFKNPADPRGPGKRPDKPPGPRAPIVLVSGSSRGEAEAIARAEEVGRLLAEAGAVVLTGGGPGVMEAASRGARSAGGMTMAILPGANVGETPPNPHVDLPIFTGMREARNVILVHTAASVIAIGGGWGTLSEIALARKAGRTVVRLSSWDVASPDPADGEMPLVARDAAEAVRLATSAILDPYGNAR